MDGIRYVIDVAFQGLGLGRYLLAGIAPAAAAGVVFRLARRFGRGDAAALTARRSVILLCAGLSPMLFIGAAHAIVAAKDMTLGAVVRTAAVNSQYVLVCESAANRVSLEDVKAGSDFLRAKDVLWPNADRTHWAPLTVAEPVPCGARPSVDLDAGVRLKLAYVMIFRLLSAFGYATFCVLMVVLCVEWGGGGVRRRAIFQRRET